MKYELIVRPETFPWRGEFNGYESVEIEAFGQWQGETRRDDPHDIRWVQDSLNRLMNQRLPLSGIIMDAAARNALRSFQEKGKLLTDGIAGPVTKRALAEARVRRSVEGGERLQSETFEALDMDVETATYPGAEEEFPVSRLPARVRPCAHCCDDLAKFLAALKDLQRRTGRTFEVEAGMSRLTLYTYAGILPVPPDYKGVLGPHAFQGPEARRPRLDRAPQPIRRPARASPVPAHAP